MSEKHTQNSIIPVISSTLKFKIFLVFCIVIHSVIALFAQYNGITPLFQFNLGSIAVYVLCIFILHRNKNMVFYIGYLEIILHSFLCILLIGNGFGFSMYFISLVPMAYHLLHATNARRYLLKASGLAALSFILFASCYIISNNRNPMYTSDTLDRLRPYVYILNMLITFSALTLFSILFLLETESAYNRLFNKNQELGQLANKDPLTGLFNRRTMTEHVMDIYGESKNPMIPFSLIMCDIDDFKKINDTYGHECGDVVLKAVSESLLSMTRGHDFLCRWGGEEFLIFLKNIDAPMAKIIAERIRIHISRTNIDYNDISLRITMTFGVASSNEAEGYEELFRLADERLYCGKRTGKNVVVL